jgi:hypothetical protein
MMPLRTRESTLGKESGLSDIQANACEKLKERVENPHSVRNKMKQSNAKDLKRGMVDVQYCKHS